MLNNPLYTIKQITADENAVEALVELNAQHEIFKAHFPSQPVLPGACILQMMKDILQTSLNKILRLSKADEIKFLSMIQPTGEVLIFSTQYSFIRNSIIKVHAKILKADIVCCKLKALYIINE
jgi:3-hydroxyacyl-[acyl-carrier-protein] dehydratase